MSRCKGYYWVFALVSAGVPAVAAEADALAISANIQTRHLPFNTILDPIFASSTSNQIVGYTRCGDSALWTGVYIAAESFRFKVTQAPDALANLKRALSGLKTLTEVTGDNRLARCVFPANSPFAAGIQSEEAHNGVHAAAPLVWIDNTSRDQVVGAFFGLAIAYDLIDDSEVKSIASDTVTRMIGFISRHQWSPNDDFGNTFEFRPESLQMLLEVARHVNPSISVSGPFFRLPLKTGVLFDVQSNNSYFKFNLAYMSLYNLVRLQNTGENHDAYQVVRAYTAGHKNAFFNMVDRAIAGPEAARDAETRLMLDQWLQRPRRDFFVDVTPALAICGSEACLPVPVPSRPPTDFLWQRNPFQLMGGGTGLIETAGIDYILPYWMARYYGVLPATAVQSAAAPIGTVAPGSLASLYGTNLAAAIAQASSGSFPTTLAGVTLNVIDAAGVQRAAPLYYVSPAQINFVVPQGTVPGPARINVANGSLTTTTDASVASVAPALFSMNSTGSGVAAATAIRTQLANPQVQVPVQVFQCLGSGCTSMPIQLGIDTPVYVSFYGTGIRGALSNVKVSINGQTVPVLYAGPSPNYTGLDQVNVALTFGLRGAGESNVVLEAAGTTSNTVTINIQ